jgi:hypothetical protein
VGLKLYLPKKLDKFDKLKSVEAVGRKIGKPVGSYVIDLADLQKSIALCRSCVSGFDPKAHDYIQHHSIPNFRGKCDACRQNDMCVHLCHETKNY